MSFARAAVSLVSSQGAPTTPRYRARRQGVCLGAPPEPLHLGLHPGGRCRQGNVDSARIDRVRRDLPLRPRLRRERRVLAAEDENGLAAASAYCESAHEHACELASDRLLEASESRRSGVFDLGQGSEKEFVASLALR
jgi:hypothetical protein